MAYLQRYTSTSSHIKRVLHRKLDRCLAAHGGDRDEVTTWINQSVEQAIQAGLVDDDKYIRDRVRSYLRRGTSTPMIAQKLYAKGVRREQVERVLNELQESMPDPRWTTLAAYIRRVRMGPFRTNVTEPREQRKKDLARLGRAGFSMGASLKMLEMSQEEIEEIAFQRRFI